MENVGLLPAYTTPHYSTKFTKQYYHYIEKHHGKEAFYAACAKLAVPATYLLSDNNWFSDVFLHNFLEAIKETTGDADIAKNAGSTFLNPENINPFEYYLVKLMPPAAFFHIFPISARKVNHAFDYQIDRWRPGHVILSIKNTTDIIQSKDICKNAVGILLGVKNLFNLTNVEINHNKCIHTGGTRCEFEMKYSASKYWLGTIKIPLIATGIAALAGFITSKLSFAGIDSYKQLTSILTSITLFSIAMAAIGIQKLYQLFKYNQIHYQQAEQKEQALYSSRLKLDRRYREANLLRELSLNLISETSTAKVILKTMDSLEKKFNYKRSIVMLMNSTSDRLLTTEVRGLDSLHEVIHKLSIKYPADKDNPQMFANVLEAGTTQLINDIDAYKKSLNSQNQNLLTALNVKSLLVVPIQDATYKYGLLVVGAVGNENQLNNDDKHLIENLTNMLSLYFKNARAFEKERTLKEMFQKYVPSVVMDSIRRLEVGDSSLTAPKNNAITSMFIDLRGFTNSSESQAPEKVVEMLNLYIDHVTDIIAQHGGIVDNLVGDGIVSFFPAIEEHRTLHAKQALLCAIDILSKLSALNIKLKERGFPAVKMGIGLHSGNATVGNVGGRVRVNYTAIGDTVNVAARLEGMCKEYAKVSESAEHGLILYSEAVNSRAPLVNAPREIGQIHVRGREDALTVYCIDKAQAEALNEMDSNIIFNETTMNTDLSDIENIARRSKDKKVS